MEDVAIVGVGQTAFSRKCGVSGQGAMLRSLQGSHGGPGYYQPLSREIKQNEIKVGMSLKVVPVKSDGRIGYGFRKA